MQTFLRPREKSSEPSNWRRYGIVVAEQTPEGWSAWFRDFPQEVCVGDSDLLAIMTLVETYGSIDMDIWDMEKLDARSHATRLEYLLAGAAH